MKPLSGTQITIQNFTVSNIKYKINVKICCQYLILLAALNFVNVNDIFCYGITIALVFKMSFFERRVEIADYAKKVT